MQNTAPAERQWYLASKMLSDVLTPEEHSEWEILLKDEKFRNDFEQLRKHWHRLETTSYGQIDKDQDWQRVLEKIRAQENTRHFHIPTIWRYAAVLAGLMVISLVAWNVAFKGNTDTVATVIQAPKGARTFIVLPDSSSVWLNAESRLSFDQRFGKDNRNITLEGEAFFDVKKNQVAFKIHATDFNIAVLGTAFNVKAYPKDDILSTTLIRGSLNVTRTRRSGEVETITLKPGEKVSLRGLPAERDSKQLVLEKNIDAAGEADWKDGWLTVRGESLYDLCKKIERLYNVTIRFEDETLKAYRYTGRIQQLSLEQVLHALSLTSPVDFSIDEKNVILRINESTKSKYKALQKP
jgi:ferric-dicitrate binding protein FerR (iron transport regulator)